MNIKEIRNRFAHNIEINDFENEAISSFCEKLYSPQDSILAEGSPAANPRNFFIESCSKISSTLSDRILKCERIEGIKDILE